ncbi:MAG: hypothetical protein M3340_02125 [Actinomycetota bacterium]|nr:hypothetical protein [Actinomycetota bacterium]
MSTQRGLRQHEARLQQVFKVEGHRRGENRCAVCGYDAVVFRGSQTISASTTRRSFARRAAGAAPVAPQRSPLKYAPKGEQPLELGLSRGAPRRGQNALLVCRDPAPNRCHDRHTGAVERIPRSALRSENFRFGFEYGLDWIIDAEYPETERRAA